MAVGGPLLGTEGDPLAFRFAGFTSRQAQGPSLAIAAYQLTALGAATGLGEAVIRALADGAYADLIAQLATAGFDPLPTAPVHAAIRTGPARHVPGNREEGPAGAYFAVGAREAPMIARLHTPLPRGDGQFAGLGAATQELDALLIAPSLVIALNSAAPGAAITAASQVVLMTPFGGGTSATGGAMRLERDHRLVPVGTPEERLREAFAAFNRALVTELAAARAAPPLP